MKRFSSIFQRDPDAQLVRTELRDVKAWVKSKANKDNANVLHVAVHQENNGLLEELLRKEKYQSLLNRPDGLGRTALYFAIYTGNPGVVRKLLLANANMGSGERSAIHEAVEAQKKDVVRCILELHPEVVNAPDPASKNTPLHVAAMKDLAAITKILIDNGADVHARNSEGNCAVKEVFHQDRQQTITIELLLEHREDGCDCLQHVSGGTLLHKAAERGDHCFLRLVVPRRKTCLTIRDQNGNTVLDIAVMKLDYHAVEILLQGDGKATVNLERPDKRSVLQLAIPDTRMVRMLLEHGAHVAGPDSITLLNAAVQHPDVLELLIDTGANVNASNAGRTALHNAVDARQIRSVKLLIAGGADVNPSTGIEDAPLNMAISPPRIEMEIVQILLHSKANPNSFDLEGRTPLCKAVAA
ncbi:ankyrin repeat-containing domain protein, partial [Hyaloscypha sp. PMI_1271]